MIGCPAKVVEGRSIIQEWLDRRTRLLILIGRMVQQHRTAGRIISPAADGNDLTGLRVFCDRSHFHGVICESDVCNLPGFNALHGRLDGRVHGCIDLHGDVQRILAADFLCFFNYIIDICLILRAGTHCAGRGNQQIFYVDALCEIILCFSNIAMVQHLIENIISSVGRMIQICIWIVVVW